MDDNEGTRGSDDTYDARDVLSVDGGTLDVYIVWSVRDDRFRFALEETGDPSSTILEVTPGFMKNADDAAGMIEAQIDRVLDGRTWRYADPDQLRGIANKLRDTRDDWTKAAEMFALAAHEANKRKGEA